MDQQKLTPEVNQLLEVAAAWSHNRQLYSGWLIAPDVVRRKLDWHTEEWFPFFYKYRSALSPLQRLDVLYELNWRLERLLSPIWDHFVECYIEALSLFVIKEGKYVIAISDISLSLSDDCIPRLEIEWLSLAFAITRYYREERKNDQFEEWHAIINSVTSLTTDDRARLCNERCLYELARMNDEVAAQSLLNWPDNAQDVCWTIRKAGLLAEIGHLDDALALASDSLKRLKRGTSDSFANILSLSREGWALKLYSGIHQAIEYRDHTPERPSRNPYLIYDEVWRRYRELAVYWSDPDQLLEVFSVGLSQPIPIQESTSTERVGFQPDTVSVTRSFRDEHFKANLMRYQFMRFQEESGIPPHIFHINFTKDTLTLAAKHFKDRDPVRVISLMCRLLDKDVIDLYLSRHRIASMPKVHLLDLRSVSRLALSTTLPKISVDYRAEDGLQERFRNRAASALRILARTIVRDSLSDLQEDWKLAINLYRQQPIRMAQDLDSAYRELIKSLITASPGKLLADIYHSLCDLPFPGEAGFTVQDRERWLDPATEVGFKLSRLHIKHEAKDWNPTIKRHLKLIESSEKNLKQKAIWRIQRMHENGILPDDSKALVASIFWKSVETNDGLPWDTWGQATAHLALYWPSPAGMLAQERVKVYLLNYDLGEVRGGFVNADYYFDLVLFATNVPDKRDVGIRRSISWRINEATKLFEKCQSWLDKHGEKDFARADNQKWGFFNEASAINHFMYSMWDVFNIIIIPILGASAKHVDLITKYIEKVSSYNQPIGAVLPSVITDDKTKIDVLVVTLIKDLNSDNHHYRLTAMRGIVTWARLISEYNKKNRKCPAIHEQLYIAIAASIAYGDGESEHIRLSLDAAVNILKYLGNKSPRIFRRILIMGLERYYSKAEYQFKAHPIHPTNYERFPQFRKFCVRLAFQLSQAGHSRDPIVLSWLDLAKGDTLPEIREIARGDGYYDEDD